MAERKYKYSSESYFEVPTAKLRSDISRGFPLFLYFRANDHLVLRFYADQELPEQQLEFYRRNGLMNFYCPQEHYEAWQDYLRRCIEADTGEKVEEGPITLESDEARSNEAADAIDVMTAEGLSKDERQDAMKVIAREVIGVLASLGKAKGEDAREAVKRCKEFTEDIVKVAARAHQMSSIYEDIGMIRALETPHSAAVSAFAVIIAMGTGFCDKETLADLSIGALMHDLGFVGLNPELFASPLTGFTPEQAKAFQAHVDGGLKILAQKGIQATDNVRLIIEQHHERFDGKGYPKGLRALAINELAQIVAMADILDDLMTGRHDGTSRSPGDALEALRKLQGIGIADVHVSPELHESFVQLLDAAKEQIEADLGEAHEESQRSATDEPA